MTMTKSKISQRLQSEMGFSRQRADGMVEGLVELIRSTLASGEDVLVSGFGKFIVSEKRARKGRNPSTGQGMVIGPKRVVTFRVSGNLRNRLNAG